MVSSVLDNLKVYLLHSIRAKQQKNIASSSQSKHKVKCYYHHMLKHKKECRMNIIYPIRSNGFRLMWHLR